jgi:hypothetical protein
MFVAGRVFENGGRKRPLIVVQPQPLLRTTWSLRRGVLFRARFEKSCQIRPAQIPRLRVGVLGVRLCMVVNVASSLFKGKLQMDPPPVQKFRNILDCLGG